MDVLDHTETSSPTLMKDIFTNLIGEDVSVYISGSSSTTTLNGQLQSYNGFVLHLTSNGGRYHSYIPADKVSAICSGK